MMEGEGGRREGGGRRTIRRGRGKNRRCAGAGVFWRKEGKACVCVWGDVGEDGEVQEGEAR